MNTIHTPNNPNNIPNNPPEISESRQINEAIKNARDLVTYNFGVLSQNEMLVEATRLTSEYEELKGRRITAQKLGYYSLLQILAEVYPDTNVLQRMQVAVEISERIIKMMGPSNDVSQPDLIYASESRDTAIEFLADSLTPKQVHILNQIVQNKGFILPDDYDAYPQRYLAKWLAEGYLDLNLT